MREAQQGLEQEQKVMKLVDSFLDLITPKESLQQYRTS